jgi:hypothetical protein
VLLRHACRCKPVCLAFASIDLEQALPQKPDVPHIQLWTCRLLPCGLHTLGGQGRVACVRARYEGNGPHQYWHDAIIPAQHLECVRDGADFPCQEDRRKESAAALDGGVQLHSTSRRHFLLNHANAMGDCAMTCCVYSCVSMHMHSHLMRTNQQPRVASHRCIRPQLCCRHTCTAKRKRTPWNVHVGLLSHLPCLALQHSGASSRGSGAFREESAIVRRTRGHRTSVGLWQRLLRLRRWAIRRSRSNLVHWDKRMCRQTTGTDGEPCRAVFILIVDCNRDHFSTCTLM